MSRRSMLSRRAFLQTARAAAAAAAAGALGSGAAADEHIPKTDAKYQDRPNGIARCGICLQFKPPNRCQLVEGDISPQGWCQFFAARENAQ